MAKKANKNRQWYIGGLHFECTQCGNCCSGPNEGHIWITKPEIIMLAEYLKLTVEQVSQKFLKQVSKRTSIIEEPKSKDCIFMTAIAGKRGCCVYDVRPNQCRTWPFWNTNLASDYDWNMAASMCPGINRGKLYTYEEIDKIRKQRKWWQCD